MIRSIKKLGFPWETEDPFLFCVYHADAYPKANDNFGPDASLAGRNIGRDFTLKDGWRMYHGETIPGFPMHPHRGFETITVVERGMVDHADSLGAAGRYGNGDVQWMTAGAGIQHSEMFPLLKRHEDNPLVLFQIWLNLPGKNKFVQPYFTMHWNENIPRVLINDENNRKSEIKLVAGYLGERSALDPAPFSWAKDKSNQVLIWIIHMHSNATLTLPASDKHASRSLFYYKGDTVNMSGESIPSNHAVKLKGGHELTITNGSSTSSFLYLQGIPIGEPVVNYGPFVMNSADEIQQAIADYRNTQFGGWPWNREDMVHGKEEGRFAKYPDGTIKYPS